jgi:hypothetical protein
MLPRPAKIYISFVIGAGLVVLLLAAESWSSTNLTQFTIFLALTALASTLKIRIPGIDSTITPNFVFLLLAINVWPFSQVIAMSLVAAVTQCLWASFKRPRVVQVSFSAAALMISSAAAYPLAHWLAGTAWDSSGGRVILAGCIYFPLNSVLVATVIGLVSGQTFRQICGRCDVWALPYFMGGIAFAALVTVGYDHSSPWRGGVILIPAVLLFHVYFRNRLWQKLTTKSSA